MVSSELGLEQRVETASKDNSHIPRGILDVCENGVLLSSFWKKGFYHSLELGFPRKIPILTGTDGPLFPFLNTKGALEKKIWQMDGHSRQNDQILSYKL